MYLNVRDIGKTYIVQHCNSLNLLHNCFVLMQLSGCEMDHVCEICNKTLVITYRNACISCFLLRVQVVGGYGGGKTKW